MVDDFYDQKSYLRHKSPSILSSPPKNHLSNSPALGGGVILNRTPNLIARKLKWKPEVPLYVEMEKKYNKVLS